MARRSFGYSSWSRYVPVAERRRKASHLAVQSARAGRELQPVRLEGTHRAIARTFWGSSWCENLERYSDFSNRLPRGRTYVRSGAVIDLKITAGKITALVSGSEIYSVEIGIEPLETSRWRRLCADCSGGIDSLVELLQGRFAAGVMTRLCDREGGMFPAPRQISMECSCPDWATMCKHVAAVLYGVGARLDSQPELLFELRQVDHQDLIAASATGVATMAAATGDSGKSAAALEGEDLGALFGIELEIGSVAAAPAPVRNPPPKKKATATARSRRVPRLDPFVDAAELRDRGVPSHVIQKWLNAGLLVHSGMRGIYLRSKASELLVDEYLGSAPPMTARGRGSKRKRQG